MQSSLRFVRKVILKAENESTRGFTLREWLKNEKKSR